MPSSEQPPRGPDIRIRDLELQLEKLLATQATLKVDLRSAEQELAQVRSANEELLQERESLRHQLEELAGARFELSVGEVGGQLKDSLVQLGRVPAPEDAPVDYVARSVRFDLKASLAFDDDGNPVLRFPRPGEAVAAHELAGLQLEFDAIPRPTVDLSALQPLPHLRGLELETARGRVTAAGLAVGAVTERESLSAAGTIVDQDPPAGAYAEAGTAVDLVVAIPMRVTVPEVVGQPQAVAELRLHEAGLEVGPVALDERDDVPAGTVVSQSPAAGERAHAAAAVTLTVAAAPPRVEVPAVRGLALAEAVTRLEEAGLRRGDVGRLRSDQAAGTVLRQQPASGRSVAPGTAVDLTVAETTVERSVSAPDLVGLPVDEATTKLREAGWGVRLTLAPEPDPVEARSAGTYGTVVAQDPVADQPVPVTRKLVTLEVIASPRPVTDVKGIGPSIAERLADAGVRTVGELTTMAVDEVADVLGVGADRARTLHAEAEVLDAAFGLEGLEGISAPVAVLLARADVRHRASLADADAASLAQRLREIAKEHPPSEDVPRLTAPFVARLVENARSA
jgi:eukaryotic-like serine/threonine-protein kinase